MPDPYQQDRTYSELLQRTSTHTSQRAVLGVIAEYEEAIRKEGDKTTYAGGSARPLDSGCGQASKTT